MLFTHTLKKHRGDIKMKKEIKAMELFGYGYKDSVIAVYVGLSEQDVRILRMAWERWE